MAPPSFRHLYYRLVLILIFSLFTDTTKAALQIPTRPTTFPLSRPTLAGEVVAWGSNLYGQISIPPTATNVVAIAAGLNHNLALKADGSVVAWGRNERGQCNIPTDLNDVVAIACGFYHSLALKNDGTVVAWGITDARIAVPSALGKAVGIAANEFSSIALRPDGTALRWGVKANSLPQEWTNIVQIRADFGRCLALREDGFVIQTDNGGTFAYIPEIASLGSGLYVSTAIRTDGAIMTSHVYTVPAGLKASAVATSGYSYLAVRADSTAVAWGFFDQFLATNMPPRLRGVIGVEGGENHFLALKLGTPPIPTTATASAQIVNGFIVALNIIDGGEGYAEPPQVTITGGGGSGATATAQINKGVVTGFTITNAGIGYTTQPDITIDPPPFLPTLGISPSRVNVTMQVVPGKRYLLESATELPNFSAIGQPFTAQSNTITNEFIINQTGQFFRIQEVP